MHCSFERKNMRLLLLLAILAPTAALSQWGQIGQALFGNHTNHWFGFRVELDQSGEHIIIGSNDNEGLGGKGNAQVFQYNGTSWVQKGSALTGDNIGDEFGCSVDISPDANFIAVGSHLNDNVATDAGFVRVYEWSGSNWAQKGADINGIGLEDRFGADIEISADGNVIVVGAPQWYWAPQGPGYAKVFEWDGANWNQKGSTLVGDVSGDLFGLKVSMSQFGDTIAVSAPNNSNSTGEVNIYYWDGSDWSSLGNAISGEFGSDNAGISIDLTPNGSTICIGAYAHNNYAGHVRVFDYNGTSWNQRGLNIDPDTVSCNAGASSQLSDDGNRLVVGQPGYDGIPWNQGRLLVYDWDGSSWTQFGSYNYGQSSSEGFGNSSAISGDGEIITGSAYSASINNGGDGYVKIFGASQPPASFFNENIDISFYPNPATDFISIDVPNGNEPISVSIFNTMGELVLEDQINGKQLIQIKELPKGYYLLQLSDKSKTSLGNFSFVKI